MSLVETPVAPLEAASPLRFFVRVVTFRATPEEFLAVDARRLAWGMAFTIAAGIGRYWDDPGASLLQHLGLGSAIYALFLAALLWFIFLPLRVSSLSYAQILGFITMTAPLAFMYAIPVERWTTLATARDLNVWFLLVVALWRVLLLARFAWLFSGQSLLRTLDATLLPLTGIVTVLTLLNLERAVFDVMSGLGAHGTANDKAYGVLFILTILSFYAVIPLAFVWFVYGVNALNVRSAEAEPGGE